MTIAARLTKMLAWVLFALVVCACVDKVPDDPAVLKQQERHEASWDQDVRVAIDMAQVVTDHFASLLTAGATPFRPITDDAPLPTCTPRRLRQAADSSPPSLFS